MLAHFEKHFKQNAFCSIKKVIVFEIEAKKKNIFFSRIINSETRLKVWH